MKNSRFSARPDEVFFRVGTGAFALLLIVIVGGIAFELGRQSSLSIAKFGWQFWQTDVWDPVADQFGSRNVYAGKVPDAAAAWKSFKTPK